jgi:predicted dehydrogenase
LNWDLWLGQAPSVEYRAGEIVDRDGWGAGFPLSRAHRYYRWWYEYSGGKLTDWGAHHVDIALWALDKLRDNVGHVVVDPLSVTHPVPLVDGVPTATDQFNTATEFSVSVKFSDGVELMVRHDATEDLGFSNGIMFEGTAGRFLVNREKLVGKPVEELRDDPLPSTALAEIYGGTLPQSHMQNFMECVKTRRQPISDVASHNRTMAICHAVNIALRLGRQVTFDTETEQFVGDPQANSFVQRPQRKRFEVVV